MNPYSIDYESKKGVSMKKLLIGVAIGIAVSVPVTVSAVSYLPWTNNIYNISDPNKTYAGTVSVFDDAGNKCYILKRTPPNGSDNLAISCVKQ